MGHGAYSVPPWGKPGVCQPMGTGAECTRMPGIALPQHLALPPKKKEEKFNGGEQTGKIKMFHICFIFLSVVIHELRIDHRDTSKRRVEWRCHFNTRVFAIKMYMAFLVFWFLLCHN